LCQELLKDDTKFTDTTCSDCDKGLSDHGEESHTGHSAAKNVGDNLFYEDSVSTEESCPHMGGRELGSSSQCNTSDKDSESKYEQESEDDQESLGGDIPSIIALYEGKSLDDNTKKRKGFDPGSQTVWRRQLE
jgi:hypothetical protein